MASVAIGPARKTALPPTIRSALARVGLRLRVLGALKGLGTLGLILSAEGVAGMSADVFFVLPRSVRLGVWGVWTATAVAIVSWRIVRPLLRRLAWQDLAAAAETGQPHFGERLISSVSLVGGRPHGSPDLIAALVDRTADEVRGLSPAAAVSARRAVARLVAGLVAALLVAIPAIVKPDPFGHLLRRFLNPWADIERVGRFEIEVSPGNRILALGDDLNVSAVVRSRFGTYAPPQDALLEWTWTGADQDQKIHRLKMTAEPGSKAGRRKFAIRLPKPSASLSYRIASGRDSSQTYRILVVKRPAIVSLRAFVEPPAYMRLRGSFAADSSRIEAWQDSRVRLELKTDSSLREAEASWPTIDSRVGPSRSARSFRTIPMRPASDRREWSATLTAEASGPFRLHPRDLHGFESLPTVSRQIVVRPDAPPRLIVATTGEFETNPQDVLSVGIVARDDFAVRSVELHYEIENARRESGPKTGRVSANLAGLGTRSARGEARLELAALDLKPGDEISYRVRAADNRPAPRGPNVVWSSSKRLRIVEHSETLSARAIFAERLGLRSRLEAIRKSAADNRQAAERLRQQGDLARRDESAWTEVQAQDLSERVASGRALNDRLRLLARDFGEHPVFHPLSRPTRLVAEIENASAIAALESAARAGDASARATELDRSLGRLASTSAKLDELLRKFDELTKPDDDRRKLRDLAERQDRLASTTEKSAAQKNGESPANLKEEQDRLGRELDELFKNSPESRSEFLAIRAQDAADLAARARALADRQRGEARRNALNATSSPAFRSLAAKQRALEDDARRFGLRADEPLIRNQKARVDADALARAVEPLDRGDIEQARDRIAEAESALNRLGRDLRELGTDPKALARRLAQRQESLRNDTAAALGQSREHPPETPEGKAALAARLKPLADRQDAIARLSARLATLDESKELGRRAAQATARAADDSHSPNPREIEAHQNEARDSLNRLADALPDPNQRRDRIRQKLNEARARFEEVSRELERHLRETEGKPGEPRDSERIGDLARRIAPLAEKQREIAAAVSAMETTPDVQDHRDRAARRAELLAGTLETIRRNAPSPDAHRSPFEKTRPILSWRLLGPFSFESAPPVAFDRPIDLKVPHADRQGKQAIWREVRSDDRDGAIDLKRIFSGEDRQSAFGYAEIQSKTARQARLSIGSDDTLTIWLNGRLLYDYQGMRPYSKDSAQVEAALIAGVNRFLVKCGNGSGEWKYSVSVSEEPATETPAALARTERVLDRLEKDLPAIREAAKASLERFRQKLDGQQPPADDLAEELAADQRNLGRTDVRSAEDQKRIVEGLRNLDVPDAESARSAAVQTANRAAQALRDFGPEAAEVRQALDRAEEATQKLAAELTDRRPVRGSHPERAVRSEAADAPTVEQTAASASGTDRAGGKSEKPTQGTPDETIEDPELGLNSQDAAEAAELARRQRRIRQELQTILGEGAERQGEIRDGTIALGREFAGLRNQVDAISPRSRDSAQAAADLLSRAAPEIMDRARESLRQARAAEALQAQRSATDLIEQAARRAEDLSTNLRADRPAGFSVESSGGLATARSSQGVASSRLAQANEARQASSRAPAELAAAQAMRRAAEGLRTASEGGRSRSRNRETLSDPTSTPAGDGEPSGGTRSGGEPDLAKLKAALRLKNGRAWGELPDHLRTEILQMSQGRYREEYQRLIHLYFREIASDRSERGARQ